MPEEDSYCLLAPVSVMYWNYTGLLFRFGAFGYPAWEYCGCTGAVRLESEAGAPQLHHVTPLEKRLLPSVMCRERGDPFIFVLDMLAHWQGLVYKEWALQLVRDCLNSKWVTGSRSGKMELLYSLCCRGGRRWGNLSGMTKLWRDRLQNWSQFSWVQCFNTPTNSCCWTCVYVYILVNQGTGDAAMGCFKDRKSRTALNSFVNKTLLVNGRFSHGLNLQCSVNKTTVLHRHCSESAASTGAERRLRLTLVAPASGNPSSCPQTH